MEGVNSAERENLSPLCSPDKKEEQRTARINIYHPIQNIVIVGSLRQNDTIVDAAKTYGISISYDDNKLKYLNNDSSSGVVIIDDFEEEPIKSTSSAFRMLGPTALIELADTQSELPKTKRPIYCLSMCSMVIVFGGFRDQLHLEKLIYFVRCMGAKVQRDVGTRTTHVVSRCAYGSKYDYAVALNIPIMSEEWVIQNWNRRKIVGQIANDDHMMTFRLKPFINANVCFFGFTNHEEKYMTEILMSNGGKTVDISNKECSHIVINDLVVDCIPPNTSASAKVVCKEWFWSSVRYNACMNSERYLFRVHTSPLNQTFKDMYGSPNRQWDPSFRKMSTESVNSTFLDWSEVSLDGSLQPKTHMKHKAFQELINTEKNYVKILETIISMKEEIENPNQSGGALLNATEVKIIFEKIVPIYNVHKAMLEEFIIANDAWCDEICVGSIIIKHVPDLQTAYPPFVNFYEESKKTILLNLETNARFYEYITLYKNKPQCGRQRLDELMIRPIQRIGHMVLLLKTLFKYCEEDSSISASLKNVINELLATMTQVNEDKRKTERLCKIFDVFNKIQNCPPDLISSHRLLTLQFEAKELIENISKKGDALIFFLFSDILEIARVKNKMLCGNSSCSSTPGKESENKIYKHISMISLSSIRSIVDIVDTESYKNAFALCHRQNHRDRFFTFTLTGDTMAKSDIIKILCQQKALFSCVLDPDQFLRIRRPESLGLVRRECTTASLTKAAKCVAMRAKNSMSQVLQFNSPMKTNKATAFPVLQVISSTKAYSSET